LKNVYHKLLFPFGALCVQQHNSACDSFLIAEWHFFFHGTGAPSGSGPPLYRGFTITLRHTILGSTLLAECSARHRDHYVVPDNPQHSQKTPFPIRCRKGNAHVSLIIFITKPANTTGARGGTVGWGTALQGGRSRVRFPMVSLEFFIEIILAIALWPWIWLSL